jgi:hypothetical protein
MANDYTNEAVANWAFESGSLLEDGTAANDLTETSTATQTVSADATDKQQGNTCLLAKLGFRTVIADNRIWWSRSNALLSSDFPFKEGESNNAVTVCFWFKMDYSDVAPATGMALRIEWGDPTIIGGTKRIVFNISKFTSADDGSIGLQIKNSGGSTTTLSYDTAVRWQLGTWYHVAFMYDRTEGSARIRVFDNSTGALLQPDKTSSAMPTTLLTTGTNQFVVHASGTPGGGSDLGFFTNFRVDDLVVFGRILTTGETDQIRLGTFGPEAPPSGLTSFPASRPAAYDPDLFWQPDNWTGNTYTPSVWGEGFVTAGGGRWGQQLVAIGKDLVYYEALT